jgi:2-polyprenyl-3-methyl-5-hydroxy-6-metoxy-1,4-benzoquinol methylase
VSQNPSATLFDWNYARRGAYHWSWYYDTRWPPYVGKTDAVVKFFSDKKGRFLEIGCGDGLLLHLLSKNKHLACFGIDISGEAIRLAHEQGVHNCAVGIAEEWRGECDYVYMGDTLEHIKDYVSALDAVARIVAQDGMFILVMPKQEAILPLDFHMFNKHQLFKILNARFDVIEYQESETDMRFVCTQKGRGVTP